MTALFGIFIKMKFKKMARLRIGLKLYNCYYKDLLKG